MFYQGGRAPWFSALDTVRYYEELAAASGGAEGASDFSRLFLVPGMGHCRGGAALDEFDLPSAVVNWVEQDRAPERVDATGTAFPGRSRPLCPHPQDAHYVGSGDPDAVASFECR